MDMKCIEGSDLAGLVSINLEIPDQEEIDIGALPVIRIDAYELIFKAEEGDIDLVTAGLFEIDVFELLSDGVVSADHADIVAEWLERWASDLRNKFQVQKI